MDQLFCSHTNVKRRGILISLIKEWSYINDSQYEFDVVESTLVITNVQMSESGMYQCVAKNGLGMTHASARLNVIESTGRRESI